MIQEPAIRIENLHKSYGSLKAVQGMSLSVQAGEIFSLLGPNGAGKSTTLSILSGLIPPTEGEAFIMGKSVRKEPMDARKVLGVVPQDIALYMDMSARENLEFWGRLYGLRGKTLHSRIDEALDMIDLADRQKERLGAFSGGMKRRVNIAAALLHRPSVVIMDEPTVGIDPQSRRHILDGVKALRKAGQSVVYTTHYMEEAEEISDRIAIMDRGVVIALGSKWDLVKRIGEADRIDLALSACPREAVHQWKEIPGVREVLPMNGASGSGRGSISVLAEDSNRALPAVFEAVRRAGIRILSVEIREPNLETVFLKLTGRALRD
jgi:linearmycin/streptolysin S transport system ATP-binding protein